LTVDRELESGLVEVVRIGLPALLTIQTGINEPRYATLRAIKQARDKPLATYSLEDVGLDAGALAAATGARVVDLRTPERGAGAELLDGSPAELAKRIVDIVQERMSG
jgi:electron transfer flavoprotein beta subunit